MKRLFIILLLAMAFACCLDAQRRGSRGSEPGGEPPRPNTPEEKRILDTINEVRRSGNVYLEVPDTDGRMLRVITETANAKRVVEVGTSTGYSGLWISLALQRTGGQMTTLEIDPGRAAHAREHFRQAGVDRIITVVEGDAHKTVRQIKGPVDVVFIDADKPGYVDYLNALLPLVRPGGVIMAHNIDSAPDYVKAVTTDPNVETVFYMQGNGLGITLKKR